MLYTQRGLIGVLVVSLQYENTIFAMNSSAATSTLISLEAATITVASFFIIYCRFLGQLATDTSCFFAPTKKQLEN